MTGEQVQAALLAMTASCTTAGCFQPVAGIRFDIAQPDLAITLEGGVPLKSTATYTVSINSYMYGGGGDFPYDPSLVSSDTGQHMRDPVMNWTLQLGTTQTDPLQNYLDSGRRDTGVWL